ncbi:MAG: hypothetical protein QOH48_2358 [Actinomycetota bacterium]|jgi:hypothetical protein|nr:hypothetical protein [Actinomycetota bacterium]
MLGRVPSLDWFIGVGLLGVLASAVGLYRAEVAYVTNANDGTVACVSATDDRVLGHSQLPSRLSPVGVEVEDQRSVARSALALRLRADQPF